MRALYTVLLYLATPFVLLRLLLHSRRLPAYRRRWGERFGFVQAAPGGVAVWVHAVSVGESLAALPLIRHLVARHGEGRVWVTTTTPTGSARITAALGDSVRHSYAPYDLPGAVARFLRRVRPAQVVVMETELWPNLFRALARRGIRPIIANARLSPRSFRGYCRVRGFAAKTLACVGEVAAQSEADAARFRQLGARRVTPVGNIKFDVDFAPEQIEAGRALRAALGESSPVWVAASTHEGEEEAALAAHAALKASQPRARLILVPRHPQRFETVARLVAAQGLTLARRSAFAALNQPPRLDAEVLLGDSMGEMLAYFAASDVAFVGGSFAPVGGHNVLEPAALGLPVLFGPVMHNFLPARELLLAAGAAEEVAAAPQLGAALAALFGDAARRARMGRAGSEAVARNRGALGRLIALLDATSPHEPSPHE